mgnify:CR=1 FL=1
MKLISWNVNGLRACLKKGFEDTFNQLDADVFCIQETKMQPGQAQFEAPGYEQYWYSAEKKGYSGTAVFTRRQPLSVTYDFGIDEHRHRQMQLFPQLLHHIGAPAMTLVVLVRHIDPGNVHARKHQLAQNSGIVGGRPQGTDDFGLPHA